MAQSTDFISIGGSGSAPQSYAVPGAQQLDLQTAIATFDGTGAAGAFKPVFEIRSPAGQLIAQGVGEPIAAGSSRTVTFAPFLGRTAAAGGGVTTITSADGSIIVTNPGGPTTDLSGFVPQTTYEFLSSNSMTLATGAADTFTWTHANGSSLLDLTVTSAPLVKTAGMWAAVATTRVTANFTAGGYAVVGLAMGDGGVSNQTSNMFLPNAGPTTTESYGQSMTHYMSGTARISLSVFNNDGAANRTFSAALYVVRIT